MENRPLKGGFGKRKKEGERESRESAKRVGEKGVKREKDGQGRTDRKRAGGGLTSGGGKNKWK